MRDLWYLFVQASMNIGGQSAERDRLVVQTFSARKLGVLLHKGENMEIIGTNTRTSHSWLGIWRTIGFEDLAL